MDDHAGVPLNRCRILGVVVDAVSVVRQRAEAKEQHQISAQPDPPLIRLVSL